MSDLYDVIMPYIEIKQMIAATSFESLWYKWYPVAYDTKRQTIVTVLPDGAHETLLTTTSRTP